MPKSAVPLEAGQTFGYMPKSARPITGATQPVTVDMGTMARGGTDKNFMDIFGNILPSAGRFAKDTASGLVNIFNPDMEKNTLANVARVGAGAVQLALPGEQGQEKYARSVGDFYKERYGSLENAKQTLINDPVGVLGDVSSVFTAGGSAASRLGTVGRAADTAGDVSRVAQVGQKITNVGRAIDPVEGLMGAFSKGVKTVGDSRVGQKLQRPFASSFNPEIAKLAAEKGVDLPVSAQTGSKAVKTGEAIAQHSLTQSLTGNKLTNRIEGAGDKLGQIVDDLTNKNISDLDIKGVGETIKTGFKKYQDDFNLKKNALYNSIPPEVDGTKALLEKTRTTLEDIVRSKADSLTGGSNTKFYEGILENLTDSVTVNNLKKTRTEIGQKLKNFADPIATGDKASLKRLYAALSDDLDTSIKSIDPSFGTMLDEANNFYRDNITKINSKIGKKILKSDPEKLINDLIKPNSESTVELVREIVGEGGFRELQEGFLQKILNASLKDGKIDVRKLRTQVNRYGDATIKKLLDGEQYERLKLLTKELDDVETLKKALKEGVRPAEGSQTAFIGKLSAIGGTTLVNPAVALKVILGDLALNALFSTKKGQKYLTSGVDVATPISRKTDLLTPFAGKASRTTRGAEQVNKATGINNRN